MPDPHNAERVITLGCDDAKSAPHALRLQLTDLPEADRQAAVRLFLEQHVSYNTTSTAMFVDGEHQVEGEGLCDIIAEHYRRARTSADTIEDAAEKQARNFMRNLASVRHVATGSLPSMRGHMAVIVGAGPSLDDNAHHLRGYKGPIIAVNTSVGALAYQGVTPSFVVTAEHKPVTEGLLLNTQGAPIVADLTTNHKNADASALWFVSSEPNFAPYARQMRMLPIAWSGTCTSAATSLALALGASRVALIGQDCAFSGSRMYAKGTPYEDTVVTLLEHSQGLVARIDKPTVGLHGWNAAKVRAIGGGEVVTHFGMLTFPSWFQSVPVSMRGKIINCTAAGMQIDGIEHAPIETVIKQSEREYSAAQRRESQEQQRGNEDRAQAVIARLRYSAKQGLDMSDADAIALAHEETMLHMWVAVEKLKMRRETTALLPYMQAERVAEAVRRGCREILEACE